MFWVRSGRAEPRFLGPCALPRAHLPLASGMMGEPRQTLASSLKSRDEGSRSLSLRPAHSLAARLAGSALLRRFARLCSSTVPERPCTCGPEHESQLPVTPSLG